MKIEKSQGLGLRRAFSRAILLGALMFVMDGVLDPGRICADGLEIMTPRPSATIIARVPETHLVLRNPAGGIKPKVEAEGKNLPVMLSEQDQGSEYLHYRLPLKRGKNIFIISPGAIRLELNYQSLLANLPKSLGKDVYLFHKDDKLPASCTACHDLRETRKIELLGFEAQESCASCHKNLVANVPFQHSSHTNKLCLTCHQQSLTPWRIGFPTGKIEEKCFACHTSKRKWRSKKYVHGLLNVGGCTVCHNPHGDQYRFQLWAEGSRELCNSCHGDKEVKQGEKKTARFVHGIIAGGGCLACHDPHAADNQFLLRKPGNALCLGCHPALIGVTRGHPVGGHPVSGVRERLRKRSGKELGCVSCHDPHGSPYRYLLIGSNIGGQLCKECHK